MPFGIFSSRWAGVLTGRITKKQSPPSSCDSAKSKVAYQKPAVSGLLSPPSTIKVVRDDVVIKTEEVDSEDEDDFASPTRDQRVAVDSTTRCDQDILPSVERSTSPEEMILLPSIETSLLGRLRGGNLENSDDGSDEAEYGDNPDGEDHSDQRDEEFEPEASPDFPAGRWNIPEEILEQYQDLRRGVGGSETWTATESHLHRLLGLRGHHPLMPGEWKRDFTGFNLEDILFAPVGSGNAVALRTVTPGMSAQFRATKALGRIFSLPARVGDLRREGDEDKYPKLIATLIEKEILRYLSWVQKDAGLDRLFYASNIGVYRLREDSTEAEITEQLNSLMTEWADGYREWYVEMGIKGAPRTLFALVVLQHIVFVITRDASDPDGKNRFLAQLDLSRSDGRWLDHALNLALPINLARDGMVRVMDNFAVKPVADEDSDPDA
ncbi:hypothetical protein RB594_000158 [Gaeumannomyces avenae]